MNFVTFRRHYLDSTMSRTEFQGKVIDIGGKKDNKRGRFRPPLDKVESWQYLNLDPETKPDFLGGAEQIPVADGHFDMAVMTEVIEHLSDPEKVLIEVNRVLKPRGSLVATLPFLYPIHADPFDFQRWTDEKLRRVLAATGFEPACLEPMGGIWAVAMDLIYAYTKGGSRMDRILRRSIRLLSPFLLRLDGKAKMKDRITTGFYLRAVKVANPC